jgi:hypothetical protein
MITSWIENPFSRFYGRLVFCVFFFWLCAPLCIQVPAIQYYPNPYSVTSSCRIWRMRREKNACGKIPLKAQLSSPKQLIKLDSLLLLCSALLCSALLWLSIHSHLWFKYLLPLCNINSVSLTYARWSIITVLIDKMQSQNPVLQLLLML